MTVESQLLPEQCNSTGAGPANLLEVVSSLHVDSHGRKHNGKFLLALLFPILHDAEFLFETCKQCASIAEHNRSVL